MDRIEWLKQQRHETETDYTKKWSPLYGDQYGLYPNTTHLQFMQKFLGLLSRPSTILDAACGAGRYFPYLLEAGHTVLGIDQSQGMLEKARQSFPAVQLEKVGLQELSLVGVFDGAICMDAMENVCPEDWPGVLINIHRSLKPRGFFYFTVETAAEDDIKRAYLRAKKAGLPVIIGEWPDESSYHYYPSRQLVRGWLRQVWFELMEEGEGDQYHHFLVRT